MTLCIAGLCRHDVTINVHDSVVVCFDRRIEAGTASAETGFKFEILCPWMAALSAGSIPLTDELKDLYRKHFNKGGPLPMVDTVEELRKPFREFRERKAEGLVQSKLAISHREFIEHGKDWLPEKEHSDILYQLESQFTQYPYEGIELILICMVNNLFRLFKLSRGEVDECADFSVIGSGTLAAEPVIYQRSLQKYSNVSKAIYTIYEAKKLAENAPGVGRETTVILLQSDGGLIGIRPPNEECYAVLATQFGDFGPKEFTDLRPTEELFEPL